jgi:hypothetical protein
MTSALIVQEDGSHMDESPQQRLPDEAMGVTHDLTLRDGSVVHVRAIHADDTVRLQSFHAHLSMESIIFRFFRTLPNISVEQATQFTHVDYVNRMALVATRGEGEAEELLAVVRYDRTTEESEPRYRHCLTASARCVCPCAWRRALCRADDGNQRPYAGCAAQLWLSLSHALRRR